MLHTTVEVMLSQTERGEILEPCGASLGFRAAPEGPNHPLFINNSRMAVFHWAADELSEWRLASDGTNLSEAFDFINAQFSLLDLPHPHFFAIPTKADRDRTVALVSTAREDIKREMRAGRAFPVQAQINMIRASARLPAGTPPFSSPPPPKSGRSFTSGEDDLDRHSSRSDSTATPN